MSEGAWRAIVVMGPSGCGKTTLASALAESLGWKFVEGDTCHPEANRAKMAAGIALDDHDREPFLDAVGQALAQHREGAVASCSALKRSYRDRLRASAGRVLFVLPVLGQDQLAARMSARPGHFMPVSLLASQLATLERPGDDEDLCEVAGSLACHEQVAQVRRHIAALQVRGP
ncbi:gluconokinase [Novosphingobium profundi]|uniref:gluconokinase n=1 Tax=Novosphingobium profundi TaxID=1774954 RepID=UPI001BDB25DA|nr:gluconokinase [Novosphingobium profundi]MBT0670203.1 gluconokinase [Novosphingobium profundi]